MTKIACNREEEYQKELVGSVVGLKHDIAPQVLGEQLQFAYCRVCYISMSYKHISTFGLDPSSCKET